MSDFMGKTLGTFSNLLSNVGFLDNSDSKLKLRSTSFSKSHFLSKLRSATTKKEKEIVVSSFLSAAEKHLSDPNLTESQVENYVHLVLCCESLGFQAPFIYVHAIKLAQKGNLSQKTTGYLAAASLLHPNHELTILLVNSIQKDLESANPAEVMLGLQATCNLINSETVHNVFHIVLEKLHHQKVEVRKLATFAVHSCLRLANSESAYKMALPKLEKVLSDSDLSVVAAVVPVIYNIVENCSGDYSYLIESLIQIQDQLLQRKGPRQMEYQHVPAPWLQIRIMKFFSLLCKDSEQSEKVFPILKTTLQKAELNNNITYAVIAEVIETITTICSNEEMIQLALTVASKFLHSGDGNLKFVGVQSFTKIVQKMKPSLDVIHQESIIECLNHLDNMLQKKTLELLFSLANPSNARAVCKKLIEFMDKSEDEHWKKDLGSKVLEITNQYNLDNTWYLSNVNRVLLEIGNSLPPENVDRIIDAIQQEESGNLKTLAKEAYFNMCQNGSPPTCIVKIICSIYDEVTDFEGIFRLLLDGTDEESCTWLLISLRDKLLTSGYNSSVLNNIIAQKKFTNRILQQIQKEILNLADLLKSCENIEFSKEVDPSLSFLDDYVCDSLVAGLLPYRASRFRVADYTESVISQPGSLSPLRSDISSLTLDTDKITQSASLAQPSYCSLSSSSLSTFSQDVPFVSKPKIVWTKKGREADEEPKSPSIVSEENAVTSSDNQLFAGL